MFSKLVLPLLSLAGIIYAVYTVILAGQTPPAPRPLVAPPSHPACKSIAGSGVIESRRKNIPVDSPVPGTVWEVFVKIHDRVAVGDPLFRTDDRTLKAEIAVRKAALEVAEAQLAKLKAAPRPEDIPPARATLEEAKARLKDAEIILSRSAQLKVRGAGTPSDYDRDRFAYQAANATAGRAAAELARIESGTWKHDLQLAEAQANQARKLVESTKTELDRLTVRSLIDGEVLQVNVRPGQVAVLNPKEPHVVLGDVDRLHLRVDIDEQDLPRFRSQSKAVATLRGRPEVRLNLEFVDVEPYVIPKTRLTGDNTERVDTRVLQVIYALPDERQLPVYVGQQTDVYLEAADMLDVAAQSPIRSHASPP